MKHEYVPIFSKRKKGANALKATDRGTDTGGQEAQEEEVLEDVEQAYRLQLLSALRHVIASEAEWWEGKSRGVCAVECAGKVGVEGEEGYEKERESTGGMPFQALIFCDDADEAVIKRVRKSVQSGLKRAKDRLTAVSGEEIGSELVGSESEKEKGKDKEQDMEVQVSGISILKRLFL